MHSHLQESKIIAICINMMWIFLEIGLLQYMGQKSMRLPLRESIRLSHLLLMTPGYPGYGSDVLLGAAAHEGGKVE